MLAGDVKQAELTFWNYFRVWQGFSLMPERFLYGANQLHPTEQYYPLRPELMESALYLHEVGCCTDSPQPVAPEVLASCWNLPAPAKGIACQLGAGQAGTAPQLLAVTVQLHWPHVG